MNVYPLYSGSSGNATLIEHGNTRILVDAGVTGKALTYALSACGICAESINAMLVTHEHSDHIKSIGIMSRRLDIPIFANAQTWQAMESKIGKVSEKNIRYFDTDKDFSLQEISILPFAIPHDAAAPVAFSFAAGGKKAAIATDIGHVTSSIYSVLEGSDLLLMESNHDVTMLKHSRYPQILQNRILGDHGHLSNASCAGLLTKLYDSGVKRTILGHLSQETNTERLAYETVSEALASAGIGIDYMLKIAHRDRVCGKFEV